MDEEDEENVSQNNINLEMNDEDGEDDEDDGGDDNSSMYSNVASQHPLSEDVEDIPDSQRTNES